MTSHFMLNFKRLLYPLCSLFFCGCTQEINYQNQVPENIRAIVINEGVFPNGTASITLLKTDGNVTQDIFRGVNNRPLGDVAQSITAINDLYYIPINNGTKVEVVNQTTFQSVETMTLHPNTIPMYITHLGGDSAVVSDQEFNSALMIVDLNHHKQRPFVRRTVDVGMRSFHMRVVANKLFVGGDKLTAFDLGAIHTDQKRMLRNQAGQTIPVCDFAKIICDYRDRLWVLSPDKVYCIDPVTETCLHEITFDATVSNMWNKCIDISADKKRLYINAGASVYSLDVDQIGATAMQHPIFTPTLPEIAQGNIYSMHVSKEETIFLCNVFLNTETRATIYEYKPEGTLVRQFTAGIFPHDILFL